MKPFDFEAVQAGTPVLTRTFSPVSNLVAFPVKSKFYLRGVVNGRVLSFNSAGAARDSKGNMSPSNDLFLAVEDVTEWLNLYKSRANNTIYAKSFDSEAAADIADSEAQLVFRRSRLSGRAVPVTCERATTAGGA